MFEKIFTRYFFDRQFLPTLEDIQNENVKKLAKRLKAKSPKETLTKIVDWQERNLTFWTDRMNMTTVLLILLIVSVLFLPLTDTTKYILTITFSFFALIDFVAVLTPIVIIIAYTLGFITFIYSINFVVASKILSVTNIVALSIIFGGIISLCLYLILRYKNIKALKPDFTLGDIFKFSLSVNNILKYYLAICRDYAKLTASLLVNIYPNHDIYFISISGHVACAIKINNIIYVLDQRLPVFTKNAWFTFWKEKNDKKKLVVDILKMNITTKYIFAEKVDSVILSNKKIPIVNLQLLTNRLVSSLKINQTSKKNEPNLEIPFKNYSLKYDENDIVIFSLIQAFTNKINNELCGDIKILSKIEIIQNNKDLILRLYMK